MPGPRPGGALSRPPRPGPDPPRRGRQLCARPHLGRRPQHGHLQLPDDARHLPVRGVRRGEAMKPWKRGLVRLVVAGAVLYAVLSAALFAIMLQPPDVIGSFFKRIPWPFFATLPMERLWLRARA